jgi:hypothetical protein
VWEVYLESWKLVMKKVLDLKFLVEEMIDISGRYISGDFDSFYNEIKNNLNAEGIIDKKDVMKAIKNCKNVDLEECSFQASFYYFIKEINQRSYQISV